MVEISNEKKQQEFVTNKLLIVFTMVFCGIFMAMYLYKMSNSSAEGYLAVIGISNTMFYISTILTAISGVKWYLDSKKGGFEPCKLLISKHFFCVFAVVGICFALTKWLTIFASVKYIYILLTAIAVQYFVLVTYSKDIYVIAITNIVNLALLYFLGTGSSKTIFFAGISIVFLISALIFVSQIKKNAGNIKSYSIFKKNTNYKMLYANIGILCAITILSTALSYAGYSIGVIIGGIYLIVIIFYNTLKLL